GLQCWVGGLNGKAFVAHIGVGPQRCRAQISGIKGGTRAAREELPASPGCEDHRLAGSRGSFATRKGRGCRHGWRAISPQAATKDVREGEEGDQRRAEETMG